MPNKIGRFEVLSEIASSSTGSVYKASDPESGQLVALKTIRLETLGEQAAAMTQHVMEEAQASKVLSSHNIAVLYGAGEMDGQFCAGMEYVQGNSIATMLARNEGFSIWDLQDIARQTCQGLDHAHVHKVVHHSLEPAKIMVQWDGTVKILGFGISGMGAYAAQASGKAPEVLHYMSPEQLRGDPLDARSNLFSLGAILYEMVTERKAFDGEDADQVRQLILETTPVAPGQINRKAHPALSEVIMKALSKEPEQRYQSGQELVNDLERCKESATKAAANKPAQPPQGLNIPPKLKATSEAAKSQAMKPTLAAATPAKTNAEAAGTKTSQRPPSPAPPPSVKAPAPSHTAAAMKASAAAAGWEGTNASSTTSTNVGRPRPPKLDPSEQFRAEKEPATMSAASTAEPEVETPSIAIDPMMDESKNAGAQGRSFSEIDELPPLKEIYIAPPSPPATELESLPEPPKNPYRKAAPQQKPKMPPREVAKKAVTEIKKTPPKLFGYSITAAVGIILLVVVAIAFRIHSENSEDNAAPAQSSALTSPAPAQPNAPEAPAPASSEPSGQAPAPVQAAAAEPAVEESAGISVKPKYGNKRRGRTPSAAPALVPGQLTVNSTPEGAQLRIDGRSDPSWITPYNLAGLTPGQHTVIVSKPGYAQETRTIEVASGSKSFLVVQLPLATAGVSVASEPPGAAVFVDGKDTGRVTPAQISVDKPGHHTLLVRKQNYLDETITANLQAGQTFRFAPTLRALGFTQEIKTAGKFKKMFGGGGGGDMGTVSIKTQPKGAQIIVNRRVIDKASPVEFYLNPGAYLIDITLSGYRPIHRAISVEKGNKVTLDETLQRQ
jgi:serine/threonine protein kinase